VSAYSSRYYVTDLNDGYAFTVSSLSVSWHRVFNTGTISVTVQISLYRGTYQVFNSHFKSSQADFRLLTSRGYIQPTTELLCAVVFPFSWLNWTILSEWVSYITTDGQSASLSWCQAPVWGLWPNFYYCQTIAGLLMWSALSDERSGLSFTMYNVQYVNILHVILRYSLTHTHTHTHTTTLSLSFPHTHIHTLAHSFTHSLTHNHSLSFSLSFTLTHTHSHTHNPTPQFDSVVPEDQFSMPWRVNSRQTDYST
jgi:hypothetical protein